MNRTRYSYRGLDAPTTVRSEILITSVVVDEGPGHDVVHVWNRGGKAGSLVVDKGDGARIAHRLVAGTPEIERSEVVP